MASIPLTTRFWSKVRKTPTCWLWTGAQTHGGYGVVQIGPRGVGLARTHRLSWELHFGPIPDGLDVCHSCDNPPCVNPAHLFVGTARDNVRDMVEKGRARGSGLCGMRHHQAKLTDAQVIAIRELYATGDTSLNRLAAHYSVSKRTILNIVKRKVWTHL